MTPRFLPRQLPGALRVWGRITPLLVMCLMLLLAMILAVVVYRFTHEQQRARFEREVTAHTTSLEARVTDFNKLLQATRAYWLSTPTDINPQNFNQFARNLQLTQRYPDVQALGYVAWLPSGAEATLETLVNSFNQPGLPPFQVRPETTSFPYRVPIVLIAPPTAANISARGFDMYSEASRRDGLDRARRMDGFQVSAPVQLVQNYGSGQTRAGFLVYLPVWRSAQGATASPSTRGELTGFLYLAVKAEDFARSLKSAYRMDGITASIRLSGKALAVEPATASEFHRSVTLRLGGTDWQVEYFAPPTFGQDVFSAVPYVIVLMGLLLAGVAFQLMQAQVRARERAEQVNRSLGELQLHQEQSRAEFEAIFQSMQDAAAFTDPDGRIRMVNRAMNRQFRYSRGQLEGQPLSSLHSDRHLDSNLTFDALTTPYRRRDLTQFQGEAQRTEVRDQNGSLLGLLEVVRDVSERVQAEQALQAEERRSRGVLDAIPHVVWVSDSGGQVTYMNASHRRRLGTSTVRESLYPLDMITYDRMWQDAYERQAQAQAEVRLQIGQGGADPLPRWFEVRVAPLLDDSGQAREWVASATDIHDRLVAERLSQRNEARYRGVLEGMPQIVWLTDPEGETTYFNPRWEEYAGLDNRGFLASIHPDDRADYQQGWREAVRENRPFEEEHRLLGADGRYRTFVSRGLPVRDAFGHVIEWVGTSTDVDDSVNAENTARLLASVSDELTARVNDPLAERQSKYRAVLNLITERLAVAAALWTAPDWHLLVEAHVGENWLLPHVQELIGQSVQTVVATEETLEIPTHPLLHAVAASGGLLTPLIALDGTLLGVLGLAYRQELHDRDHELIMEMARRIAESLDNDALRARAQAAQLELVRVNQSLEESVQRRTLALQEANRELEAFSYSVSHDLRTPLRHVVGFGELLRKESGDALGSKGTRYLNVITDAATRMNNLIDSLLEFSRMGRAQMQATSVNLEEVIRTAWANLEPDRQGREVIFEVGSLPRTIEGDPALLDLVFQNLLSNALKYTSKRPVAHVTVTSEVQENAVTIHVQDNGVGFDPKYAERLFGVFQRLHRAEEFDGTGIGLANVRRIVTRHGGSVQAQSVLGEGAVFTVILPLHAPENL